MTVLDVAVAAGIYEVTTTWDGAVVHDFDLDGWPDLLLNRHLAAPARLYRNTRSGTFEEVSGVFSQRDRHSCTWADFNRDGRPDVYCTIGGEFGTGIKKNELMLQRPGGAFVDRSGVYGVADPYGRGRATVSLDVNADGYMDLFVGNQFPRQDTIPSPNRLFINQNGVSFRDAPEYGLDQEVGAEYAQAADFNGDGWTDLLVCTNAALKLYRNDSGTGFTDVTAAMGVSGKWTQGLLVDLDLDGTLDLVLVNISKFRVRLQKAGRFEPSSTSLALPRVNRHRVAAGDVNVDGLPDLYVVNSCDSSAPGSNLPDLMLLNQGAGQFAQTSIPQISQGCGEAVAAIDFDRDGRTDFLVTNGFRKTAGPVQLLRFQ